MLVLVALVAALAGCTSPEAPGARQPPAPATTRPTVAPRTGLAALPVGDPPEVAYAAGRTTIVFPDRSVRLEHAVSALTRGSSWVWAYAPDVDTLSLVDGRGSRPVSRRATAPVFEAGIPYWIEDDRRIVYNANKPADPQPLPAACCRDAAVLGADYDMDPDVFVRADGRAWVWDTYEGREGTEYPPPDSDDYFWPVGGLEGGTLVRTGIGSEVLVRHSGRAWGWGFVGGPRVPGSATPVGYRERERVAAREVWLSYPAIVAVDRRGRLVELVSVDRSDQEGHYWRRLTGQRSAFDLPAGLRVRGVVADGRRAVLVDTTDRTARRAWVRCDVRTHACELAAELDRADVVPTR